MLSIHKAAALWLAILAMCRLNNAEEPGIRRRRRSVIAVENTANEDTARILASLWDANGVTPPEKRKLSSGNEGGRGDGSGDMSFYYL